MTLNRTRRQLVLAAIAVAAIALAAFGPAPAQAAGGWIDPNGAA